MSSPSHQDQVFSPSCEVVSEFLRRNTTPTASQRAEIAESLRTAVDARTDLGLQQNRLWMQLSSLQRDLTDLEHEYRRITRHIDHYRATAAPIRRIPPEVLSHIFVCYSESIPEKDRVVLNIATGPWLLTHVSTHWRNVAASTPALWGNFKYHCSSRRIFRSDPVAAAKTWLQRTAAHPLSISFYCEDGGTHTNASGICAQVFDVLLSRSTQWQVARLEVNHPYVRKLASIRGRLPLLRKLHLTCDSHESRAFDAFEIAPRLYDLCLRAHFRPGTVMKLPWEQITHGTGDTNLLHIAPHLVHCSFEPQGPPQKLSVVHTRLKTLHILSCVGDIAFGNISFPARAAARCRGHGSTAPVARLLRYSAESVHTSEAVQKLLTASRSPLTHLHIDHFLSSTSVAYVLWAAPTVRTLTISRQGLKGLANLSYLFRQLTFDPSSTRLLLPALTSLVMIGIVLDDSIVRMVESRRVAAGVTRLESISIADADGTSQAHLERLQQLEGLRVMID
ncbi:hypothetical protein C8J57DRAFT_1620935 [Mycena rebaudengoi]|nr:hypothetical protein C8J57DRAFT_1620935 [Mycena rebaudengoi]